MDRITSPHVMALAKSLSTTWIYIMNKTYTVKNTEKYERKDPFEIE